MISLNKVRRNVLWGGLTVANINSDSDTSGTSSLIASPTDNTKAHIGQDDGGISILPTCGIEEKVVNTRSDHQQSV